MDQDSYVDKTAAHADERLRERTKARPRVLHELRKKLRKIKLERGTHHARIPGYGIAVLKDVGKRHVVATVLSDSMRPPGKDVTMKFHRNQLVKIASRVASQIGPVKPPPQTVTVKGLAPPPAPSQYGGVPNAPTVKTQAMRTPSPAVELSGTPKVTTQATPTLPTVQNAKSMKPQPGTTITTTK